MYYFKKKLKEGSVFDLWFATEQRCLVILSFRKYLSILDLDFQKVPSVLDLIFLACILFMCCKLLMQSSFFLVAAFTGTFHLL